MWMVVVSTRGSCCEDYYVESPMTKPFNALNACQSRAGFADDGLSRVGAIRHYYSKGIINVVTRCTQLKVNPIMSLALDGWCLGAI